MIEPVRSADGALIEAWRIAVAEVRTRRGGTRYLDEVLGDVEPDAGLLAVTSAGTLWRDDADSFIVVRERVILGLYVAPANRRRGRGRTLVDFARAETPRARDALALPGDRATKSLYESVGWKARLLTLGDES